MTGQFMQRCVGGKDAELSFLRDQLAQTNQRLQDLTRTLEQERAARVGQAADSALGHSAPTPATPGSAGSSDRRHGGR